MAGQARVTHAEEKERCAMEQSETELARELARVRAVYSRRDDIPAYSTLYSLFNEATLLHVQSLERRLLALLKRHGLADLAAAKVLDVGCGDGGNLRRFVEYGARPENLSGIDLMAHRIQRARTLHPTIDWRTGSAHELPYPNNTFDLVLIFTVLSSILDGEVRRKIADEIMRVCKPGGFALCHDLAYSNPRNPSVQGITRREVQRLFAHLGTRFEYRRVALAPPVSRLLAPHARWLADTLEQLRVLNTHFLCLITLGETEARVAQGVRGAGGT
jgi:ubiquinone/menaquinone biosynthesis C-methylase UbiE